MRERVGGILIEEELMFILLLSGNDEPDWAGAILSKFAAQGLGVNFISETPDATGGANMSVTVKLDDEYSLQAALDEIQELYHNIIIRKIHPTCLITVYGPHFKERQGLAARAFRALGFHGINILGISTSISSITCVLHQDQLEDAQAALREVFELP